MYGPETQANETSEVKGEEMDLSKDVVVTDEDGERIAAMREYVFLNLASSSN